MRGCFAAILHTLATGYILFYFSESMFWTRQKPGDTVTGFAVTWLVYSAAGSILLALVNASRRETVWTVMLAGAAFGWITEGIVVQTTYQNFPFQVFWTSVAWHALISALLGWWALRRALALCNPWVTTAAAAGFGVFWGVWGMCWRVLEPATAADPLAFAGYAFAFAVPFLFAMAVEVLLAGRAHPLPTPVQAILAVGFLALYGLNALVPYFPLSLILPPLLAVTIAGLWGLRCKRNGVAMPPPRIPYAALLQIPFLLVIPLIASAVYAISVSRGWLLQTNILGACLTMPVGIALWLAALVHGFKKKKAGIHADAGDQKPVEAV